jgi:hypothetical protein
MYPVRKLLIYTLCVICHIPAFTQEATNIKKITDEALEQSKAASLKRLIADADLALKVSAFSVTDNPPVPTSKDINDFYSWSPYSWPNPNTKDSLPYITKDGETNPETEKVSDKPLLRKMSVSVHTLALAYHFTKDKRYAQKSAELIRTWFLNPNTKMNPNLNFGQCKPGLEIGTPTGIIDSRWFILVIDAQEILQEANVFHEAENKELKVWFGAFLNWLLTSEIGKEEGTRENNHGTWYAAQTAYYALYTGDVQLSAKIVSESKRFFDTQIDSMGRQTFELTRTKSYDYSLYNVHALITLANVGSKVGIDLWHYNTGNGNPKNILESVKYLAGFVETNSTWPFKQIADKAISLDVEDGGHFSVYYPYDLYSALLSCYHVYKDPSLLNLLRKLREGVAKQNRANLLVFMK